MGILIALLSFILILTCLLLGLLVLIQLPKKEAGFGMAFGAGAVDTLLGAGAGNALTKITKWVAATFLFLCIVLSVLYTKDHNSRKGTRGVRDAASKATAAAPAIPLSPALGTLPTSNAPAASAPATAVPAAPAAK